MDDKYMDDAFENEENFDEGYFYDVPVPEEVTAKDKEKSLLALENSATGLKELRDLAVAEGQKHLTEEERRNIWLTIYELFHTGNIEDRKKAGMLTIETMSPYMYSIIKGRIVAITSNVNRASDVEDLISSMYMTCIDMAEKYDPYRKHKNGSFVLGSTYIYQALLGCRRDFLLGGDGTGTGAKRNQIERATKEQKARNPEDTSGIVSRICYTTSIEEMMMTPSGQAAINRNCYTASPEEDYFRNNAVGYDDLLKLIKKTEDKYRTKDTRTRTIEDKKKKALTLFKGLENLQNIVISFDSSERNQ